MTGEQESFEAYVAGTLAERITLLAGVVREAERLNGFGHPAHESASVLLGHYRTAQAAIEMGRDPAEVYRWVAELTVMSLEDWQLRTS